MTELWSARAGIKLQHIPYRGGAPAVQSVVAGQTEFTALSPLVSLPQIAAGNLRALAVGSLTRYPQLPDVPTVAESGFPDFEAIQWVGLLTTAGTPKDVVERLNTEVNKALKDPDLIAKLAQEGMLPAGGTSAEFRSLIATEIKNWKETARARQHPSPNDLGRICRPQTRNSNDQRQRHDQEPTHSQGRKHGRRKRPRSRRGARPPNYSRGEKQKPVTNSYKENWNRIYGKKKKRSK